MRQMTFLDFVAVREDRDIRLIDVREEDEWVTVRAIGAELHPLSRIRRGDFPVPDGREVAFICAAGGRSAMAATVLEERGWADSINISDGTMAAIAAGEEHVERG